MRIVIFFLSLLALWTGRALAADSNKDYDKVLLQMGAFPVAKLTKPYYGSGGHVFSKSLQVDVDSWLPPRIAEVYLTDEEKAAYRIPQQGWTYEKFVPLLDVAGYQKSRDKKLLLVMRFALEQMRTLKVRVEDVLPVYEAQIGLGDVVLPLLQERISKEEAMRLVSTYRDEALFDALPGAGAQDKVYVKFLAAQVVDERWSVGGRFRLFQLLVAADGRAYAGVYREFLLENARGSKDWMVRKKCT